MKKKIGLIINPIAGLGGKSGFKGTDNIEIKNQALKMGYSSESISKTRYVFENILSLFNKFEIITCPGEMGEEAIKNLDINYKLFEQTFKKNTTSKDTKKAVKELLKENIDLLIFAGGDGTAKDIYEIVKDEILCIGIPTGVKIQSAVYAKSPKLASEIISRFILNKTYSTELREVMDIDEEEYRNERIKSKLYGYLKILFDKKYVQNIKAGSISSKEDQKLIAHEIINLLDQNIIYIVGGGSTTKQIFNELKLEKTLIGVDLIQNKKILLKDVNEKQILEKIKNNKAKIIVTIIGNQGYIFGRGNQQISAKVIRKIGKENIYIVATKKKILNLKGEPLLVDSGDPELDKELSGYVKVITGQGERLVCKVGVEE